VVRRVVLEMEIVWHEVILLVSSGLVVFVVSIAGEWGDCESPTMTSLHQTNSGQTSR